MRHDEIETMSASEFALRYPAAAELHGYAPAPKPARKRAPRKAAQPAQDAPRKAQPRRRQ